MEGHTPEAERNKEEKEKAERLERKYDDIIRVNMALDAILVGIKNFQKLEDNTDPVVNNCIDARMLCFYLHMFLSAGKAALLSVYSEFCHDKKIKQNLDELSKKYDELGNYMVAKFEAIDRITQKQIRELLYNPNTMFMESQFTEGQQRLNELSNSNNKLSNDESLAERSKNTLDFDEIIKRNNEEINSANKIILEKDDEIINLKREIANLKEQKGK